jgi:hypothetical protein
MRTKRIAAFAATAVVGLVVGTGVGMAAAQTELTVSHAAGVSSSMMGDAMGTRGTMPGGMAGPGMDAMHAAMRDQMPVTVRKQCDALHAQMVAGSSSTSSHTAHHKTL